METIDYVLGIYALVSIVVVSLLRRKAQKYAKAHGHNWYDMWDEEKYIAYLKSMSVIEEDTTIEA